MQTESFSDAVASTIAQFNQQGRDFSAHDVTTALRSRVNGGQLELSGYVREDVDNVKDTFRIDHNQVRSEVLGLYNRGVLPDYAIGQNNGPHGGYRIFRYIGAQASPQVNPNAALAIAPAPLLIVGAGQSHSVANVVRTVLTNTELEDKVKTYLDAQIARGNTPTLKRVQSRLKNVIVTCEDLFNKVDALGYEISIPSGASLEHFSRYMVVRKK